MSKKRFKGVIGEEYDLFDLAVPHHLKLQQTVGDVLKDHFMHSNLSVIDVLEIGSGTGKTSKYILDADKRIHVTAIDNEKIMIDQLRRNLEPFLKNKRVEIHEADILTFLKTVKSETCRAVASAFVLHNWDAKFRTLVLREIFRVLKKGGLFVNADKYAQDSEEVHLRNLHWQIEKFQVFADNGHPELKEEWTKHYLVDNRESAIMREGKSIAELETIGFTKIQKIFRSHMEAVIVAQK